MTGEQATENFKKAAQLVREARYQEARKVELLESDRRVIEARIAKAISR
jgi:hypothetical protein